MKYSSLMKLSALCIAAFLTTVAYGQARPIEQMTIEEIRQELDAYHANEFDRATEADRVHAVLRRIESFYSRMPEQLLARLSLPEAEVETIIQVMADWRSAQDRSGDIRMAATCEVWLSTPHRGADRIDAALLAYERETSGSFTEYNQAGVEELLEQLEAALDPSSWNILSEYLDDQVANFSGKISHSFFSRVVRDTQSVETMELHCEN